MINKSCGTCEFWDREKVNPIKDCYGNILNRCNALFPSCFHDYDAKLMYADSGQDCAVYMKIKEE